MIKVIDNNKVKIHSNSNQKTSKKLTDEQKTITNPTQNTNIPSGMLSEGQQEVRQNSSNDENGFENLFPSISFIQSLTRSYVEDVHRLFEFSDNKEEPCCCRNINTGIERKCMS